MTTITPQLAEILAKLDQISDELAGDAAIVEVDLRELRRLQKAAPHRRGGPGSRDARKYELGSVLVMAGLEDVDAKLLLGLLAHPLLMLRWLAGALIQRPPASLAELLETVLTDPAKRDFCVQWGRVLGWRYRQPIYAASITSFLESGKMGLNEPWRQKNVTTDQAALVTTLCELLDEQPPELANRGEAFEWIFDRGGNPEYWLEPENPKEWR